MKRIATDVLAARVLNASRKVHLPTYVATRFLVETVVGSKDSSWIYETIPRKYLIQQEPHFYKTVKIKNIDAENNPVYREFIIPSPTTLLAEAIVLGYLAQAKEFKKSERVYSYIWPSSTESPYSYEHYISGYKKRNADIKEYLLKHNDKLIIISDIEKFYPNINQQTVKNIFLTKLSLSQIPEEIKLLASKLLDDLCCFFPNGKGVATGPEFSHVIGDIALQSLDEVLERKYGDAYFRYVDDIIIVVAKEEKDEAIALLSSLADSEGLKINPSKTDSLSAKSWLDHGPHNGTTIKENSFEALVFQIKSYLRVKPNKQKSLEEILNKNEFNIPVGRLASASKSSGFGVKLIGLLKARWFVAVEAFFSDEEKILKQSMVVRDEVKIQLHQHMQLKIPNNPTLKKWYLQKLRYLTNRAIYLFPLSDLEELMKKLEVISEFADTTALLKTLVHNDFSKLIDMPGAASFTCANILRQTGKVLSNIKVYKELTQAQIESIAIFALWDVISIDFEDVPDANNNIANYLDFSFGKSNYKREINSFGYLSEINSLALRKNKNDNINALESRLMDSETTVLDALSIGWNYDYE